MSDKIENPTECELHPGVFKTASKSNPNRLVCQMCIDERIAKMVKTKAKNKKQKRVVQEKATPENVPDKIELDLSSYGGIRDELAIRASQNFRNLDQEIIFTLNEYYTRFNVRSKAIKKVSHPEGE